MEKVSVSTSTDGGNVTSWDFNSQVMPFVDSLYNTAYRMTRSAEDAGRTVGFRRLILPRWGYTPFRQDRMKETGTGRPPRSRSSSPQERLTNAHVARPERPYRRRMSELTTTIDEARGSMKNRRIRHLPVADGDRHLLGLISIGDLNAYHFNSQEQTIHLLHEYLYGRV